MPEREETDAGAAAAADPASDEAADARPSDPPRWLLIAVGILAAAALAFGIGRFTAFDIGTGAGAGASPSAPGTASADAGFARDMQVHHAQAVDMAMTIYRTTDDDELRTTAYDIATGQAAQAGQLYQLLVQWGLPQAGGQLMSWMTDAGEHAGHEGSAAPKTDAELRAEMGMATDAELTSLEEATGREADCRFLALMIRHHEGAIHMVDAVLRLGSQQSVKDLAAAMKQTQSAEIDAMTGIQSRLGCTG